MVTNSVKGQRSNKQYFIFVHFALRVIFEILNPFKALTQRITRSILKIISEIGAGSLYQVLPSSIHDAMATMGYWPPGSEVMGFLQPESWFYRFSIWRQGKQEKNNTNREEMWSACSCGQRKVASITSISSSKCCSWAFIILYILCRTAQNHGSSLLNRYLGSKPLEKAFLLLYTNAPGATQLSQLSIRWRADSSAVSADPSEACACWQALSSSPYSKAGTPNTEKKIRQKREK